MAAAEIRALVDAYRASCLWFLREDYYPGDRCEALSVLAQIEQHADRDGFIRAGRLRQWLSPHSSDRSAAS
jgi:hypothetical protein